MAGISNSFSFEWFCARTGFETEAKGNSVMAYCTKCSQPLPKILTREYKGQRGTRPVQALGYVNFTKVIFNPRKPEVGLFPLTSAPAAHAKRVSAKSQRNGGPRGENDFLTKGKWYFLRDYSEWEIDSTISFESNGSLGKRSDFGEEFESRNGRFFR